jgi:hypothetical protein
VLVPSSEPDPVRLAAEDLVRDVRKITGEEVEIVRDLEACSASCLILGTVGEAESREVLDQFISTPISAVEGKWESYRVESVRPSSPVGPVESALMVVGSDTRGTMFGLYEFIEQYLKVDPLYFWTGREPAARETLSWDEVTLSADEPTFRFRGWFLNDEDLLVDWQEDGGQRFISYRHYHDVTSGSVHRRVFEAMLRLGMNMVIPASFNDIANADEQRAVELATRRGLFVSMHHIEPMGVSGYAFENYFDRKGQGMEFSILKNPDAFEEVWRYYAELWSEYPNVVWQLGLRGIADQPYWGADPDAPQTDAGRGELISDAVATQWKIVQEVEDRENPPATTTLWMEGARLHRAGHLEFPEEVSVIFADNSPGWTWQDDFYQVDRQQGRDYGVYYHHQLWGTGPHLAQAVPVRKTYEVLGEAVDRGDTNYAILNVGNVREFALGLSGSAQMLRDYESFTPEQFMQRWTEKHFPQASRRAEQAYQAYFDSYVVEPIEYQGKEQTLPYWLDGWTRHRGTTLFSRLLSRVVVPSAETPLHSVDQLNEWLDMVQRQRTGLQEAGRRAEDAVSMMDGQDRRFFEMNLMAQQKIILGLTSWVEAGIQATLAEHDGNRDDVRKHVRAAVEAFEMLRAGQQLAEQAHFEGWYRGDRKMNLQTSETATRRLHRALAGESLRPR